MAVTSSSERAAGLAASKDWQAPPSAESFQAGSKNTRSKGMRAVRRIAWNLLPPLTIPDADLDEGVAILEEALAAGD